MVGSSRYYYLNCIQIVNADLYSQQLQHVHKNLLRKRCALGHRRNVVLLLDNNAKPHSVRITQEKKTIGFRLVCSTSFTILTRPCVKWFSSYSFSTKFSEWQSFLKKIRWKCLWGNFLGLQATEFYLRGINKLPDKWKEMIQNNGKYTINWN